MANIREDWTTLMRDLSKNYPDLLIKMKGEIKKAQQNQVASISSDKTNGAKSLEATAQPTIEGEEASAPSTATTCFLCQGLLELFKSCGFSSAR